MPGSPYFNQSGASANFDSLAPTTTKGDLITRNTTTNIRQAVGSDGQVLIADSSQASGIKWGNATASTPGTVAQVVNTSTGAVSTGTTQIPNDDTIPQNTEGDQYMTLAITPTSATNKLKIQVVCNIATSSAGVGVVALFQDTTANALAAVEIDTNSGTAAPVVFTHYMTAGTTSSTTFKVRAGPVAAITMTFNGFGGNRKFGGVMASSMTITEVVA